MLLLLWELLFSYFCALVFVVCVVVATKLVEFVSLVLFVYAVIDYCDSGSCIMVTIKTSDANCTVLILSPCFALLRY